MKITVILDYQGASVSLHSVDRVLFCRSFGDIFCLYVQDESVSSGWVWVCIPMPMLITHFDYENGGSVYSEPSTIWPKSTLCSHPRAESTSKDKFAPLLNHATRHAYLFGNFDNFTNLWLRYNWQARLNELFFIHILFEPSFCCRLLYPPTNYNNIIQPSRRWQHLLGPIYIIIRHHLVTILAIWQNCIIADLTILGKILEN